DTLYLTRNGLSRWNPPVPLAGGPLKPSFGLSGIISRVNYFAPFKPGKRLDGFSSLLLGEPQLVEALEIQPKLCARTEKMSEAKGSVARDGPCSVQDLRHTIGRNVDLTCQLSRTHMERFEFFGQVVAGMD